MTWRAAALLVSAAVATGGCKDRASSDVAVLRQVVRGSAERTDASESWQPAKDGDRFRVGHSVRTSADGSARIRFLAGSGLRMGPSTTIRFGPGKVAVDGELEAERDSTIDLELGRAELRAGSRVRIRREGGQLRFDVLVGSAVVVQGGERTELREGEGLELDFGSSAVRRVSGDRTPAIAPADAGPLETASSEVPDAGGGETGEGAVTGEVRGKGVRARAPGQERWDSLGPGSHPLAPGTEVTVAKGGSLMLTRGEERARVHGSAEAVVAPAGEDRTLVETRRGRAEISATAADVSIRVPGGRIVARRGRGSGSRADIRVAPRGSKVSVDSGVVDLIGDKGGKERLLLGQRGEVGRGGGLAVFGRPPERADFGITAGLSATIHDPSPPSDVRIEFAGCTGGGVLEVTRGASFAASQWRVPGESSAIVRLNKGSNRYRVRCLDDDGAVSDAASASGRLRVIRDAGTKPLPRRAPHNTVDADGRRYTVLYQNLLPSITFRWPKAPQQTSYKLVVAPARGARTEVTSAEPRHTIGTGKLDEGEYRYWFEAGKTSSKKSTLRIGFDNAAGSGYVEAPRPGASWSGSGLVQVRGGVAEGWKVSIGGTALPLDRQQRFSGSVSRPSGDRGFAIEFRHARRGVRLYVRRNGSRR